MAASYRAALAKLAPATCAQIDAWAVDHGQAWVAPGPWPYGDDELLSCAQVAELCHVKQRTVYTWHERGLPYVRTMDGIRVRVGDLKDWDRERRLARRASIDHR